MMKLRRFPGLPIDLNFGPTGRTTHTGKSANHVHVTKIFAAHNSLTVFALKTDYSGVVPQVRR